MIYRLYVYILLSVLPLKVNAQNEKIDQLRASISATTYDSMKFKIYHDIIKNSLYTYADTAATYAHAYLNSKKCRYAPNCKR